MLFAGFCITNYFVEIEWRTNPDESPYLFRRQAEWTGVKVHRARVLPGRMLEHKAAYHEINVNLGGHLITEKISASGSRVMTRGATGNLCLTPAGQPVGAFWDKPLDNMGILLNPDFVVQTAIENRFSSNFEFAEIYKNKDLLIQQIGLTLLDESNSATPSGRLFADSLIQTLLLHLLKNYSTASAAAGETASGGLSGYRLRRVTEFINENLEEDLSLAAIASVADLSQYHFARAFRRTTGLTPQQYLMQQRIERAKELLAKDDLPIVEVSLRTGFKNQSHFTTLFRKFTKLTPKNWRELKLA